MQTVEAILAHHPRAQQPRRDDEEQRGETDDDRIDRRSVVLDTEMGCDDDADDGDVGGERRHPEGHRPGRD
jgi:hypothetical protein